jgi:ATP adenylyltransferase
MNCCICSQIAGDPSNDLLAKTIGTDSYVRRIPIETDHFAVIPSLGPLVPGHVIVCPKQHHRSLSVSPSSHDEEFDRLLYGLKNFLRTAYSLPIHLFEHGMSPDGSRVLCSVDHAHLHLLPTSVSIVDVLQSYPAIPAPNGLSGLRSVAGKREYIFYEGPRGERLVIPGDAYQFESQYLRRVFSEAMGNTSEWNWREHMKPDVAIATYEVLSAASRFAFA